MRLKGRGAIVTGASRSIGGAKKEYDYYKRRLDEEYGIKPDSELEQFVNQLFAGSMH